MAKYILGIDIGTTNVKACLVNKQTNEGEYSQAGESRAYVRQEGRPSWHEQDVHKILTTVQFCVSRFPRECQARIVAVAISGQMHGCVLWAGTQSWKQKAASGRYELEETSSLYTWQDGRCDQAFLASLPTPESHLPVSTGYGCATLFWLSRNSPSSLRGYECAGTIQDLVVAMLCNLSRPRMSVQNAASWGYCNTSSKRWNLHLLESAGFPTHLLPTILASGSVAGRMATDWYSIPAGTPVYAALGDLQCSTVPHLNSLHHAVLNMSTSCQLVYEMSPSFLPPLLPQAEEQAAPHPVQYFPYFGDTYLAVAAALTGGNVLASFMDMLQLWTHQLGLGTVPKSEMWSRLEKLAQSVPAPSEGGSGEDEVPVVRPLLYGERHCPSERASVSGLSPHNLSLGVVYLGLCRGVVSNLHDMMGHQELEQAGVDTVIISGKALLSNTLLQEEVRRQYQLPIQPATHKANAAYGAALAVLRYGIEE